MLNFAFFPTVMFLFFYVAWTSALYKYIQERSTLAKIAASATEELEHRHTQQLCCGDGDPKRGCVRPCGLLKTQTQM